MKKELKDNIPALLKSKKYAEAVTVMKEKLDKIKEVKISKLASELKI